MGRYPSILKTVCSVTLFVGLTSASSAVLSQDRQAIPIPFQLQERFDQDRNARISVEELSVPERMLPRLDPNGDGFIEFSEFEQMSQRAARASLPSDRSDFTHLEDEGFPLNVNPEILSASEVGDLVAADDMVMGIVVNGEARAYPVNYMNGPYNEVVNDELGGQAIAPSW